MLGRKLLGNDHYFRAFQKMNDIPAPCLNRARCLRKEDVSKVDLSSGESNI